MSLAFAFTDPNVAVRAISPYRELGAYEALWLEEKVSFRSLAEKFRKRPEALPSDLVLPSVASECAEEALNILRRAGVTEFGIRVHGAGEYPDKLRIADHPVEVLYYQGWWDLINSRSVAIVGTRQPSDHGKARARKLVKNLIEDNFTVVSGLAKGIDTEVHSTALKENGRAIAVIGTPLSNRYPRENARLQDEIAREHLVISQVPVVRYQRTPNPTTNRFFFVERNITMSALTLATVIVEAGETSGTLVQAKHALKQGKKLFILDSNFNNSALSWPKKFEELGAIRVRDYEDIRTNLGTSSNSN